MFLPDQYELLDFGDGRKLERFGSLLVDRPSPAAEGVAGRAAGRWQDADARFERSEGDRGRWICGVTLPASWFFEAGPLKLELKLTDFGHVGVFPEQAENWEWIAQRVRSAGRPVKVLNLFAYTGGSTLAAAAAGAEVVHIDAAQNTVNWARRNAEHSDLIGAPIRWIAEDAVKFVRRELKRGNQYDAVILDPPSYGHGPKGETWQLADQLPELLAMCAELTAGRRRFMLLTCHSPGFGPSELADLLPRAMGAETAIEARDLYLHAADGRQLHCGAMARIVA